MLSERLQALSVIGVVARTGSSHGPEYALTEAGIELAPLVIALGTWGQRWLPRRPEQEDLDVEPVLIDMQRRVRFEMLPKDPVVVRFEIDAFKPRFMLLKSSEASLCTQNPGFPEPLCIRASLAALVAWWRGDVGLAEAQRIGLEIRGAKSLSRAFPGWFDRYQLAHVGPVVRNMPSDAGSRSMAAKR
jgi:hypothetical protein